MGAVSPGQDDAFAPGVEAESVAGRDRRMVVFDGGDGDAAEVDRAVERDRADVDEAGEVGAALVRDAERDVVLHRGQEGLPVVGEARRAVDRDGSVEACRPRGVEEGAKFEVMVGVQMRDHDRVDCGQCHALIADRLGRAEARVHEDGFPRQGHEGRGRHVGARPDRGAALHAQEARLCRSSSASPFVP
jgi:hypothetical protein